MTDLVIHPVSPFMPDILPSGAVPMVPVPICTEMA